MNKIVLECTFLGLGKFIEVRRNYYPISSQLFFYQFLPGTMVSDHKISHLKVN